MEDQIEFKKYIEIPNLEEKVLKILKRNQARFLDSGEITKLLGFERTIRTSNTYEYSPWEIIPANTEFEEVDNEVKKTLKNLVKKKIAVELKVQREKEEVLFYKYQIN